MALTWVKIANLRGPAGPVGDWPRTPLTTGTDLNELKAPGLYPVNTGAIARSLLNGPPGWGNPGSVEVLPASSTNGVVQQVARVYWTSDTMRVFVRQSNQGVFSDQWEPLKQNMGSVPNGTDWDTVITPGTYSLDRFSNTATMTHLPPTPGGFAGTVEVLPVSPTRVSQRATEYASGSPGVTWTRMQTLSGGFPEWGRAGWDSVALIGEQDLNSLLTPGRYRADRGSIATTIVNRPAGVSNPFMVDVTLLSDTNGVYLQELTAWDASGPRTFRRLATGGTYVAWNAPASSSAGAVASRTTVTVYGDSLTEGGDTGGAWPAGASWPERLAASLSGVAVVNRGRSGDSSDEILIRAGALALWFTVAGSIIPASGSVNLTTTQVVSIRDSRAITGTLAGISGVLRHASGKDWTFTRSAAGSAIPITGKQQFTSATDGADSDTLVYWAGRNDISMPGDILEPNQPEHLAANAVRFMEWAAPRRKQVMIVGPTTGTHEPAGSVGHTAITEANRRLRELFPANFADAQDYMVNRALVDMGVAPTPADVAAKSKGEMPPSLIATGDNLHFSQAAAANFARNFAAPFLLGRGWV